MSTTKNASWTLFDAQGYQQPPAIFVGPFEHDRPGLVPMIRVGNSIHRADEFTGAIKDGRLTHRNGWYAVRNDQEPALDPA